MEGVPIVLIVGIDPNKHEIPVLLKHHLVKIQKDFLISFIGGDDIDEKTGEVLKNMLKESKFVPEPRKILEQAKPKIEIVSH